MSTPDFVEALEQACRCYRPESGHALLCTTHVLPQARAAAAVVEAARHAMRIGGVLHANGCHFTRPGASCNCGYAALDEALRSLTSSLTQEERT